MHKKIYKLFKTKVSFIIWLHFKNLLQKNKNVMFSLESKDAQKIKEGIL